MKNLDKVQYFNFSKQCKHTDTIQNGGCKIQTSSGGVKI